MLALLTEEQEMLKDMTTQLAASVRPVTPADLATVDRAKGWAALAEAGLLSLRSRDDNGAPSASGVEVMLVAEALGAALAPLPYLGAVTAAELMARAGAPPTWLEPLTAGEVRYGMLLRSDLSRLAHVDDASSAVAFDVDGADYAVALSGSADTPALVRVRLEAGAEPVESADLTRTLARVPVPAALTVESSDASLTGAHLDGWLALALVVTAADLVGVMGSALSGAVAYAKERVQYGVKIGSFQAIQHLCADTLVDIEASASSTRYAAWAVDALDSASALLAARVAKAYASSVARQVTETAMQVFGGIGQTWEHIAHVHTRRALTDRALFGDEERQLLYIADARLGGRA
jgi:alkylation response protein AidB-like acyl-CoA dehydrogenase